MWLMNQKSVENQLRLVVYDTILFVRVLYKTGEVFAGFLSSNLIYIYIYHRCSFASLKNPFQKPVEHGVQGAECTSSVRCVFSH